MPYIARDRDVYFVHASGYEDLFLSVHPTDDCTKTPEEQAAILAELLTQLPVTTGHRP